MNVTPKVFRFTPGTKTGTAIINGVKAVMDSTLDTHHWEVVSYTSGTALTLQCKANVNRRLRLAGSSTAILAYLSLDGGATESPSCTMSGGDTDYQLSNTSYGMSTNEAYVVEIEDAIFIYSGKGTDGGTGLIAGCLGMSIAAGRLFQTHNRNDSDNGITGEGVLTGQAGVYSGSTWAWLSSNTTTPEPAPSIAYFNDWTKICWAVGTAGSRSTATPAPLANVGDSGSIERLVPIPINGPISGNIVGHSCYTKYLRARKWNYGENPGTGVIANGTIVPSSTNPSTVGWRHNKSFSGNVGNSVIIWCASGDENIVS